MSVLNIDYVGSETPDNIVLLALDSVITEAVVSGYDLTSAGNGVYTANIPLNGLYKILIRNSSDAIIDYGYASLSAYNENIRMSKSFESLKRMHYGSTINITDPITDDFASIITTSLVDSITFNDFAPINININKIISVASAFVINNGHHHVNFNKCLAGVSTSSLIKDDPLSDSERSLVVTGVLLNNGIILSTPESVDDGCNIFVSIVYAKIHNYTSAAISSNVSVYFHKSFIDSVDFDIIGGTHVFNNCTIKTPEIITTSSANLTLINCNIIGDITNTSGTIKLINTNCTGSITGNVSYYNNVTDAKTLLDSNLFFAKINAYK